MALLPIFTAPDPVLTQKAKPVETITPEILTLLDDMVETMIHVEGVGLAANQVGVLKRVLVYDVSKTDTPEPHNVINPEIIWSSDETEALEQGCFSVPEQYASVVRPMKVKVRYMDETGANKEIEAEGLLSHVLQHEIDHLNGVLMYDRVSPLKRSMMVKKAAKIKKLSTS